MSQTLSLCMIVKNEEKFLRDCLDSVYDVVDQMVIVDTGSQDGTIGISKDFDAEVYNFTWVDDFSAARNESLKHATCDWILWLDADERLLPSSKDELKKLLKTEANPVIYKAQINSVVNNGENIRLSSGHRLFTNKKGLFFTGNIHEQISESAVQLGGEERQSKLIIEHLGYDLDEADQNQKDKRNLKLLQNSVKINPQNAYAHFTLAQQYGLMKKWHSALKHYDIAERINQFDIAMTASLLNTKAEALFNLEKYEQAKQICIKSIKKESLQVGAYYMLYRIADAEQIPDKCIRQLEIILKNTRILQKQIKSISTDVLISEERILFTLALNYLKLNKREKAISHLNEALKINPEKYELREKLVEIYLQGEKWEEVIIHLQYLIQQFPQQEKYVDLLGTVLIKQQQFPEAIKIYESMIINNPNNKNSIKKLIGLYGKTGEMQKANQLMQLIY